MDIAIQNWAFDRLGRRPFAESLARQLASIENLSEGYVIGIEAEWGAGKSSVINMTLHHLLHLDLSHKSKGAAYHGDRGLAQNAAELEELCVHYEAIRDMTEGSGNIAYLHPDHHHRAIASRSNEDPDLRERIYRYFRLRLNAAAAPRNLIVHFRPWLVPDTAALSSVFLDELAKSVGSLLGTDVEAAMRDYAAVIQRLAPVAGIAAQAVVPGSGDAVRDFFASMGRSDASLESRKVRLETALRSLRDQKIIVVVDDLDRLSPREATEMVGLVKSLGNLPNIVYLMSYDRTVLCKHLRRTLGVEGEAYLEKIVQYRRGLPILSPERILTLLDDCRRELFDKASEELLDRAQDASIHVLRQYILTPRDAVRCGDWALRAHRLLKDQIDPVDLLILETLNAKDASLYSWIRQHLEGLCHGTLEDHPSIEAALKADRIELTERRKRALSQLFEMASQEFSRPSNNSKNDRLSKRLRERDCADTYFELSEPLMSIGKAALERLLASKDPGTALPEMLLQVAHSNYESTMRAELLDTIWEHFGQQPLTAEWVDALTNEAPMLIRVGDRLTDDAFSADNLRRLVGAITSGLERLPESERFLLIDRMVSGSLDLSLMSAVVRRLGLPRAEDDEGETSIARELTIKLRDKLTIALEEDAILSSAYAAHVIFVAAELLGDKVVREYLSSSLMSGRRFAVVAQTVLIEGNSSEYGRFFALMKDADKFVDERSLIEAAEGFQAEGGDIAMWADRVLHAAERRRRGDD